MKKLFAFAGLLMFTFTTNASGPNLGTPESEISLSGGGSVSLNLLSEVLSRKTASPLTVTELRADVVATLKGQALRMERQMEGENVTFKFISIVHDQGDKGSCRFRVHSSNESGTYLVMTACNGVARELNGVTIQL